MVDAVRRPAYPFHRRTPVILQHERADCGLTCLAMVAAHFGRDVSVDVLRHHRRGTGHGASLQHLIGVAARLGMTGRPVRLSLNELSRLRLPAVLHWRMNHYVVLTRCARRGVRINDPASGARFVDRRELDQAFTGIALELAPNARFVTDREDRVLTLGGMLRTFRRLYRFVAITFFLMLTAQALALVPPIAAQLLIDEVLLGQDPIWLVRAIAALGLVLLLHVLLDATRSWINLCTGAWLAVDSATSIVSHLFRTPAAFVEQRILGDLVSKVDSLDPVQRALTEDGIAALVNTVILLTTIAVMAFYSLRLTAISVGGLLLSALLLAATLHRTRQLTEEVLVHRAAQNSSLIETLRAYATAIGLGIGPKRLRHWQTHLYRAANARLKLGKLAILRTAGSGAISAIEQILFLGIGVADILHREISLGVLFAFFGLRARLAGAVAGLIGWAQEFAALKAHLVRLSDIALAPEAPTSPAGAICRRLDGAIEATALRFGFDAEKPVIRGCSFAVSPGAHVVITGPSGCGKSTLLKLLSGNLVPDSGVVLVDGAELSAWDLDSFRRQVGLVMQNDTLFRGTITENISAFSSNPDLARVREVTVLAAVWNDICALPMRTETLLGDTGTGLSGGQVQRLVLARALYRDPRILFLDEATSHLDVTTERNVLRNIASLGITVVSVAHRPDAIRLADHVIELSSPVAQNNGNRDRGLS